MNWNILNTLQPPQRSAAEEERKRAEQEHHQREQQQRQLAANERLRHEARERAAYYSQQAVSKQTNFHKHIIKPCLFCRVNVQLI